jgi:hypothetical protein
MNIIKIIIHNSSKTFINVSNRTNGVRVKVRTIKTPIKINYKNQTFIMKNLLSPSKIPFL